ncbi:MAG: 1-acyl-sn-glycerol-3-phosphate acyltransferase [Deltaproteobacteria bacterium]|nr:1-acyl-sn-glycerol-3-phosphate acyltransferase [Deltaproteobacteria bacterium]
MTSNSIPNLRTLSMYGWTLPWSIVGIIAMFIEPTGRLYSFLTNIWARQILWLGGVTFTVKGGEHIDWKKPYVICSNHQSQIDIPLLVAALPTGIRFLAKRVLFYIPIFGWMLAIARFIPVDRGNIVKARRSIIKGAKRIKKGPSLLVFPEGTRTCDGEVHPFKSGAFIMGIQASVPVMPVAIRGTYNIISKHHMKVRPGAVEIIIGKPISTEGLTIKQRNTIKIQTETAVVEMHRTGEPTT